MALKQHRLIRKDSILNDGTGFSMIEMLVALAILALGILSLARLQFAAVENNALTVRRTNSILAAQVQIETLTGMDFGDINNDDAEDNGFTQVTHDDNDQIPENYVVEWQVVSEEDLDDPDDGTDDLLEISVRVTDPLGAIRNTITFNKLR